MTISTGSVVLMIMYLSIISVIAGLQKNSLVKVFRSLILVFLSSVQKNTSDFKIGL